MVSHLLIRWWEVWNDVEVGDGGSSSGLNRLLLGKQKATITGIVCSFGLAGVQTL